MLTHTSKKGQPRSYILLLGTTHAATLHAVTVAGRGVIITPRRGTVKEVHGPRPPEGDAAGAALRPLPRPCPERPCRRHGDPGAT